MQALMLAAGMGKRLGRYTQNGTKCMVQVNGKALIEYAIEALIKANIKKFVIVTGYRSEVLKEFIRSKFDEKRLNGMVIEYIDNPIYDKTNNIYSLWLAKDKLIEDDTVLLESDIIFDDKILMDLIESQDKNLAMVSHFEPWMDGTCTLLDEEKNIVGMLDKAHFNWNDISNYYKTVNIYKLSKEFSEQYYVPFLESYQKAFGKNEYYETVLKVITFLSKTNLKGFEVRGDQWYEIDDPADLAIAENRFAPTSEKLTMMENRFGGYWRFPQIIDFCYLVNPFFPPKKLSEELKSSFDILLRAYPSGAKEQNLLAGKIFNILPEHIVVGNGAAELINSFCSMVTGKTAIPYPTFNEYPARFCNSEIVEIPVNKNIFEYTVSDILTAVDKSGANNVLLINPDNPTGHFLKKEDVLKLLDELKTRNVQLIFDESFIDFADKEIRYTLIDESIIEKYPNLVIIKSISKSYGVPGLRLGILVNSNPELIEKVTKNNSIWNINSFGEYFLQIFDKYKSNYKEACDKLADERKRFSKALSNISGIKAYPSQANYILCEYNGKQNITELTESLLENHNLLVKNLVRKHLFEGRNFMRLAILEPENNDLLIEAIRHETLK
ncbi:MAG: aminotransferase class I/II-fold pyridoxal phosphate-dependent enzyme [Treponema sp.]|nr:aminotransferase class I/II-fold pyridoxal phosphate-dependent enzyme [Treponema sp.]